MTCPFIFITSDAFFKGPGHHAFFRDPNDGGEWIAYHRWEHPSGDGPYRGQRQICLDRVSYDEQGLIRPIRMTGTPGTPGNQPPP